MMAKLSLSRLCSLFSSPTVQNFSYLLTAEGITRLARISLTVVMARLLSVTEFGVLAIALTVHELVAVFAHNGSGLALLKQEDRTVQSAANTAYLLSFGWALVMFCVQLVAASALGYWGFEQSGYLLQALAPLHLLLPLALTHVQMIQRSGRLGSFAAVGTVQNIADCAFTLLFLLLNMGVWSVVLARMLSTLVWVFGFRRVDGWSFDAAVGFVSVRWMLRYSVPVLLSEFAKSVRQWGDNLIVGAVLGADLLGIYYFAKNSGLGISLSLSQISIATITPKLAQLSRENANDRQWQRKRLIGRFSVLLTLLIGLQAALAPWYVPRLFGATWEPAVYLLSLMCVSAIPRCIADLHACLARNSGLTQLEMKWTSAYTVALLLLVCLMAEYGLEVMAMAVIGLNILMATLIVGVTWQRLESFSEDFNRTRSYV